MFFFAVFGFFIPCKSLFANFNHNRSLHWSCSRICNFGITSHCQVSLKPKTTNHHKILIVAIENWQLTDSWPLLIIFLLFQMSSKHGIQEDEFIQEPKHDASRPMCLHQKQQYKCVELLWRHPRSTTHYVSQHDGYSYISSTYNKGEA